MKKLVPVLLIMCLLCGLAACGSKEEVLTPAPAAPAATEEPVATPEPVEEAAEPAEQEAPAAQSTPEPAVPEENDQLSRPDSGKTDDNSGNDSGNSGNNSGDNGDNGGNSATPYELAQQYLGSSASSLIAAIGSPSGSEYTISCEADGAEDGVWYYDGFVVWTVKYADGTEIVRDCDAY